MSNILRSYIKNSIKSTQYRTNPTTSFIRSNSTLILNQFNNAGGTGAKQTSGLLHATGLMSLLIGLTALTFRYSERNGVNENRLHLLSVGSTPSSSSPLISSSSSSPSTSPTPPTPSSSDSSLLSPPPSTSSESEEDHSQSAAYNPETGEINWDCPCLGGMADGPCGPEFKLAFSCFVYSEQEPKGVDCVENFRGMQECFRKHPEIYGSDVDNEEETEEELVEMAEAILRTPDEEFIGLA